MSNIEDIYELSPMQHGMLYHTLIDPTSRVYCCQNVYTLEGELDISAFKRAWQRLAERHTALRTAFHWEELDKPLQVVYRQVELPWEQLDWRRMSPTERQERLEAYLEVDRERDFDLAKAPLMRFALIQTTEETYQFVWSSSQLLMDGWCLPLIFGEILAFYEAFYRGDEIYLETPRPYRDYIVWLQQQDLSKAENFWREMLKGFTTPTHLGTDRVSGELADQASVYDEQWLQLSATTTRTLRSFARQHHQTLNTLVQGAWALLLNRYSGESDVIFGAVVSGRPPDLDGVESMVGLFINTLPMRVHVSPESSLLHLLKKIQTRQAEILQYRYAPLRKVQGWSQVPRGMPLFESILVFENRPKMAPQDEQNRTLSFSEDSFRERTNYPLTLIAIPAEELYLKIIYDCRRFNDVAIARMLKHLQVLLEDIIANPEQRLSNLPLLTEAERYQLLVEWNATQTEYPREKCIHELFEAQVERAPDAVAVVLANQQLTYRELNQRANQLAYHLRSLGIGPEALVGICVERSCEMVIGLLGILKAGGAYVPLDPAYPRERLAFMIEDVQISVLVTQQKWVESLPVLRPQVVCLDTDWEAIALQAVENPPCIVTTGNLAYVLFTSGSTGLPKGVAIEHRSSVAMLNWAKQVFAPDDLAGVLASTSICFDLSVFELFVPLSWGGKVILAENALQLSALPAVQQVTLINTVPSVMAELLRADGIPPSIRVVNLAGEPLRTELVQQVYRQSSAQQVFDLYGPSEDTTYSTFALRSSHGPATIGRPITNTHIYLLDPRLNPVPIGVPGELYIGGTGLARGYLNRPALTADRFIPNPFNEEPGARLYRTGDLARHWPDGNIQFLGRIDYQVKIRGFRIELGEVEAVLAQHPAVQDVVALARKDAPGDKRLVAYVVAADGQKPTVGALRRFLQEKLPAYMVPSIFVMLHALPLTPNGKVDRRALPVPNKARPHLEKAFVAPRTPIEKVLADIWIETLGLEQVGIDDNFFELGGDSILIIQIVARARRLGVNLTPRQLLGHQTVAELATVAHTTEVVRVEQEPMTGAIPLTPIQHWFFEQDLADPHHFNQAILLEVRQPLSPSLLEKAFEQLILYHDALRLRFEETPSGWQQICANPDSIAPFAQIDLSILSKSDQKICIGRATAALQASLSLPAGPLIRVAFFDLGEQRPSRLFIVIHHLAADAASWQILLEDLMMVYQQSSHGEAVSLPPKTTTFKQWADRLAKHARSQEAEQELDYWVTKLPQRVPSLPIDHPGGKNTVASTRTVRTSLSAEETQVLLLKFSKTCRIQIDDLLLTALVRAFARWTGENTLLVDLERDGRRKTSEDLDLSRTMGRFTLIFPVLLDLREVTELGEALESIHTQIRQIPQGGTNYGVLRYLKENTELVKELRTMPQSRVLCNCSDRPVQTLPGTFTFGMARESQGPLRSLLGTRHYVLEISQSVMKGRLQVEWSYSENLHRHSTIENLAEEHMKELRMLIAHCRSLVGSVEKVDQA